MNNRFFNRNLAGGAMLDFGVYALSFIRWFMESKPDNIQSQVKLAPTGVDEQVGMLLTNKEGQMATVMLSLHSKQPKRGMVSCDHVFRFPAKAGEKNGTKTKNVQGRGALHIFRLLSGSRCSGRSFRCSPCRFSYLCTASGPPVLQLPARSHP